MNRPTVKQVLVTVAIAYVITVGIAASRSAWLEASTRRDSEARRAGSNRVARPEQLAVRGYATGQAAGVTVVVFSDYQCENCIRFSATVDSLAGVDSSVRIVHRHFPIEIQHLDAFHAAMAAECARDQGAYPSMSKQLFASQALIAKRAWGQIAAAAGVQDTTALKACVAVGTHAQAIDSDIAAAREIRVRALPSVVIDDSLYPGIASLALLRDRVDRARSRRR